MKIDAISYPTGRWHTFDVSFPRGAEVSTHDAGKSRTAAHRRQVTQAFLLFPGDTIMPPMARDMPPSTLRDAARQLAA